MSDGDGSERPLPQGGEGDFIKWLKACHDAVSSLNANLETVTVLLKNVSHDLVKLVGLMDDRPAGLGGRMGEKSSGEGDSR